MKYIVTFVLAIVCSSIILAASYFPASYVNPFIGTSNSGNTHPGAMVPWGMISVSPQNVDYTASGYYAASYTFGGKRFYGFGHTNLSGVGCPDMGSLIVVPFTGDDALSALGKGLPLAKEVAEAGYYRAEIGEKPILVEATATTRTGMLRFTFPKNEKQQFFLDLSRGLSNNKGAVVRIVNDSVIEGYKIDGGFNGRAAEHRVYFSMKFNKHIRFMSCTRKNEVLPTTERRVVGTDIGVYIEVENNNLPLLIKTGISYVSCDNARENLSVENGGWNFDKVKSDAFNEWNKELSRIIVSNENTDNMIQFYTGIYHILVHPNIISDVNGEYPLMGERQGIGKNMQRERFSVFSLWDTYRNVHPLLTLVYPEIQSKMISSLIDMYKENGWLPKWEIISNESYTMVGDPAIPVIVDSYIKGIRDFDVDAAYAAILKNSGTTSLPNIMRPGILPYLKYGYIPQNEKGEDAVWGSVATSLEYYIADWAVARMAQLRGDSINYRVYMERSMGYQKLFDKNTLLMRPRMNDGSFLIPFDPVDMSSEQNWIPSGGKGFVEGNAWQYTWFVPHDIKGLINLFGGEKIFVKQLQTCFDKEYFMLFNEPDMAYPYLFNYIKGEEWRTQKEIAGCLKKYFNTSSSGLPGNDDTGTLSAWLVFTMMGLYPDCPSGDDYSITTPSFNSIEISLNQNYYSGSKITIRKNRPDAIKIKKWSLNGKKAQAFFVSHQELTQGGNLYFDVY